MSRLAYQYDYQTPERKPRRIGRLVAIFLVVSAVIGGTLWWIFRQRPTDEESGTVEPVASDPAATPGMNLEGAEEPEPATPPTEPDPEPEEVTPPEYDPGTPPPAADPGTTDPESPAPELTEVPVPVSDPGTPEPELPPKGQLGPQEAPDPGPWRPEAAWTGADRAVLDQLPQSDPAAVREQLEPLLEHYPLYSEPWRELAQQLTEANLTLFKTAPAGTVPELIRYSIQRGDVLSRIAAKHHTTLEALALRQPQLAENPDRIRAGFALTFYTPRTGWKIRVNRRARMLTLWDGERLFAAFEVGIGRAGKQTPEGNFVISTRQLQPQWRRPDGKLIPGGSPENELGSVWLQLARPEAPRVRTGYGIHGTPHPETVPSPVSYGCLRLRNPEAEDLYRIVPSGTPVTIE